MDGIFHAVVVGAGSAGLGVSYFLKQRALDHLVLERNRIGETWRTQRWESFRLNSPRIRSLLPGDAYDGPDPWGASTQHDFVTYLESYADRHRLPVKARTPVHEVTGEDGLFEVATPQGRFSARNLVIASGSLNCPMRPHWWGQLPPSLYQLDASNYRNAADLEDGAVLVVGSGQSGGQIAEDLVLAGRSVFLATSRAGRLVRRYRGGDIFNWMTLSGYLDVPREELVLPSGKLPPRALLGATHTISLQSLSAKGVVLLGRFIGAEKSALLFGNDLDDNIRFADERSAEVKRFIDRYIERAGLKAPAAEDDPAEMIERCLPDPPIRSIALTTSNIRSVIWCTGFKGNFQWIQIPGVLDASGQPIHKDGIAAVPGVYFAGLDFATTRKSGTIPGVAEEALRLVNHLTQRADHSA
ncbi:flavin-containing monooxygenase [Sinorhizobium fredii]|uniref:FAD dependent pyridine nucleotide-disulfide oxidoreductase protein n=1 Tax=Rhizobium fredii TaxID=380 RepID=A0A2L0HAX2_RHIFR|nr:NAD(P)/FAD-dependent oxidoreductase [Sinorhizobium fredii]AUX78648.1 FAD dependent pyridine nucleotide-disulfide oxidoreductase protein [Sinorhizobium fredii]